MILSIDVGIRNLAMCQFNETSNLVVQWDVSGVPPEHRDGIYVSLRKHLDERPWILDSDIILIEKQPDRNKKMKMVEHFLHAYFVIKAPKSETIIYDAKFKIPDVVGPGKAQYTKRKKVSIERCEAFLRRDDMNKHWIETFMKSKKKDDLADTVMQAISFTKRVEPKKKEKIVKKLVPRKPNENQKRTKYSKCNLAYIYKNSPECECLENNKRFMKDLKRYYRCIDDLIKEMTH
uniref:Mitochondrial resolvase Ydc2 catalytic domain-containing protein n=1 Tax=viral metagenome TaxID=1070528 RepID=A0A6C0CMD2_9ZZZZ